MEKSAIHVDIIGAGVAGITAALHLRDAGVPCRILEKSRGVGGRLSTRQTRDGVAFDHGAQYFTARSDAFRDALDAPPWNGAIAKWTPAGGRDPSTDVWYVGAPMMKSPALAAGANLDIRVNTTITSLHRTAGVWSLTGAEPRQYSDEQNKSSQSADRGSHIVIITAPAPQAKALTSFSPQLQTALSMVTYDPCWALMVSFANNTPSQHIAWTPTGGCFSWVAKNSAKPQRDTTVETWVAHATPAWSAQNLELEKEAVAARLLPEFLNEIQTDGQKPRYVAAHRWRYARVNTPAGKPFLYDETETVFIAGDGCLGPRIECAHQSGQQVAAHILRTIDG